MTTIQTVRQRNHRKRLISWVITYVCIFAGFLILIYWQAQKVNTQSLPNGQLQVTVSKDKYTVGDTVVYTVSNGLANDITLIDNCPREPLYVYQWQSGQWLRIHDTAKLTSCAGQPKQITIASGSSVTKNYATWSKLFAKPGIYRIVAFANNYTDLPYVDFQVVAPPAAAPAPQIIYKPVYTPIYIPSPTPTPTPTPTTTTTTTRPPGDD